MWQIDASRFRSSNERPGLEAKRSRSTIFTAKDCRLERWTHRLRSKRESFSTDSKTHTVSHCPFRTRLKWSRMFINYSYCNQLQSHRIRPTNPIPKFNRNLSHNSQSNPIPESNQIGKIPKVQSPTERPFCLRARNLVTMSVF